MFKNLTIKQAEQEWNDLVENCRKQTAFTLNETTAQKKKRIANLEKDFEEWKKFYFPQYCYAPAASFHKEASDRVLRYAEWMEVRNWARELAKDTVTMMEILYFTLTGKKKCVLMISNSWEAAAGFLKPYKLNLEANARIINDYGVQAKSGDWGDGSFTTRKKVAFYAFGVGQSPRGKRNEEIRPDLMVFNDIDTDEDCRNPEIVEKNWKWIEDAAIATRSISKETLIYFLGNIIAEDCCVVRAHKIADFVSIVNIRDKEGKSTWPEKNSEEQIDRVLSQKSYSSQQKEYFNNPISEGKVFKEMVYGKCPPLRELPFVIIYADPSPSNNDKPGIRAKNQNSCKAVVVVGYKDSRYYVYKAFVDTTTNSNFIDWLYTIRKEIGNLTQLYFYIENNTLQDPFYTQVLLPLIFKKGSEPGQTVLSIAPDDRKKPDKYFRIEGNLEPLNRNGLLILNVDEKDNPHMDRLQTQFKSVNTSSKTMDGPDAVEGAVFKLQEKISTMQPGSIRSFKKPVSKNRW